MDAFVAVMNGGMRREMQEPFVLMSKLTSFSKYRLKKETEMNFVNIVNLATRASKPQDEFVLDNLSEEIQAALGEAMADEKKSTAKAAAMEIMGLVKETRERETMLVEEIRSLRRKEVEIKAKLAKINDAKQFAQTSSNYIPLALAIGHVIPNHYRMAHPELMTVKTVVKEVTEEGTL